MPKVHSVISVTIPYDTDKYLMVQERESKLWCQPGGKVEFSDNNWQNAAVREVYEESGTKIKLDRFIGNYSFKSNRGSLILCASFSGIYVSGDLTANMEEISEVKALTFEEIKNLNKKKKLRPGEMNVHSIEKLISGKTLAIDDVFHTF